MGWQTMMTNIVIISYNFHLYFLLLYYFFNISLFPIMVVTDVVVQVTESTVASHAVWVRTVESPFLVVNISYLGVNIY